MRIIGMILLLLALRVHSYPQEQKINFENVREDLKNIIEDISLDYAYLQEKGISLNCLREKYDKKIENLKTEEDIVLFFELLLDEFYDGHLILNTNRSSSYRLYAPIYVSFVDGKAIITSVWGSQIEKSRKDLIGAEIIRFNGKHFEDAIDEFPTQCQDKKSPLIKEWIANKIIAGRYNEKRILNLKLSNSKKVVFDIDEIKIKKENQLLTSKIVKDIGIIRINNSLGNEDLVAEFDKSLENLMETKGLVLDLRNTVDGGLSYVARGIMGRFINEEKPYQRHWIGEKLGNNPLVERIWIEYVSPRGVQYTKPVVILVGRWTGSMGEGLAIGFEGMKRAAICGTKMERLAGEMEGYSFEHHNFGYRLSVAKLFHINGTPREKYVPSIYVKQTSTESDEILEKGLEIVLGD